MRSTYAGCGDSSVPTLSSDDQSAWFFSVHGDSPAVTVSQPAFASPNHYPLLKPGRMLRTFFSSDITGDARSFAS